MTQIRHFLVLTCLAAVSTSLLNDKHEALLRKGYEFFYELGYYKFSDHPATWADAQAECAADQAKLVVFNSQEEYEVIAEELVYRYVYQNQEENLLVYLGYHAQFEDSRYVTVDGIAHNKTGFTVPAQTYPEGCLAVNVTYTIYDFLDADCDSEQYFVCEQQLWRQYEYVSGLGYYKLHTEGTTWLNAYDICEKEGAHLAVINSLNEANTLSSILKRYPNLPNVDNTNFASVGFHSVFLNDNAEYDEEFITIDGQDLKNAGYSTYATGQPNTKKFSHCGTITRDGKLNMSHCNISLAFFCER